MKNSNNPWTEEALLVKKIESETKVNLVMPLINKQILSKLTDIEWLKNEIKSMNEMIEQQGCENTCKVCPKVEWFMSSVKKLVDGILWHIEIKEQQIITLENEINELIKDKDDLEKKAYKDPLTGMYNRHYMKKVINENINRSNNIKNYNFCVWLIDLDHFKQVNDTYGHEAWDIVLKSFSEFMIAALNQIEKASPNDARKNGKRNIIFRYWGEEFLVISWLKSKRLKMFLDKCLEWCSKVVHKHEGKEFLVSFSAWISEFKGLNKNINDSFEYMLNRSDKALYVSKEKWRKTVTIDNGID